MWGGLRDCHNWCFCNHTTVRSGRFLIGQEAFYEWGYAWTSSLGLFTTSNAAWRTLIIEVRRQYSIHSKRESWMVFKLENGTNEHVTWWVSVQQVSVQINVHKQPFWLNLPAVAWQRLTLKAQVGTIFEWMNEWTNKKKTQSGVFKLN